MYIIAGHITDMALFSVSNNNTEDGLDMTQRAAL